MADEQVLQRVRLKLFEINDHGIPTWRHGRRGFMEALFTSRSAVREVRWVKDFFPEYGGEVSFDHSQVEALRRYIRENPTVQLAEPEFEAVPIQTPTKTPAL